MKNTINYTLAFAMITAALLATGCEIKPINHGHYQTEYVPRPISLLLPKQVKFHGFTQISKDQKTIEAYLSALDSYNDNNKAFGSFRFELYQYNAFAPGKKGKQLAQWEFVGLQDPKLNALHWDSISQSYKFSMKGGPFTASKYVLHAVFSSKFSKRLTCDKILLNQ